MVVATTVDMVLLKQLIPSSRCDNKTSWILDLESWILNIFRSFQLSTSVPLLHSQTEHSELPTLPRKGEIKYMYKNTKKWRNILFTTRYTKMYWIPKVVSPVFIVAEYIWTLSLLQANRESILGLKQKPDRCRLFKKVQTQWQKRRKAGCRFKQNFFE